MHLLEPPWLRGQRECLGQAAAIACDGIEIVTHMHTKIQ
jgi:hypothetical protein